MENRKVAVSDVHSHERCQSRAEVRHDVVEEYAEAIRGGVEFPPLRVCSVGGSMVIVDGYHRHAAMLATGLEWCRVEIVETCDLERAVWIASGANKGHGLRRSNADKRSAVRRAIESRVGIEQSSRDIAAHVGVGDHLVSEVRREWEAETRAKLTSSSGAVSRTCEPNHAKSLEPEKRLGRDGKLYPAAKPAARQPEPVKPTSEPERQKESPNRFDAAPEWTPPPSRAPKPEPRTTATPMPDAAWAHEAAEILRGARLALARVLPEEAAGRLVPLLHAEEGRLRADIPVVCSECSGAGCGGCARRGWRTSGNDRTESRRARA